MSLLTYAVVKNGPTWAIEHQGFRGGRFKAKEDAVEEAARLTREAERLGHRARLQVAA